jgi:succinylglutamic semialdehyde dehydrogenase
MAATLSSFEPATGDHLWTGEIGDADREVAAARAAWPGWASKPLTVRIETLRRLPIWCAGPRTASPT